MHGLLSTIEEQGKQTFPDFEVLEYVPQYVFSGTVGAKLITVMSVMNPEGDLFPSSTEVLYLPSKRHLFSVAFSATSDSVLRPEEEFWKIKKSIRLT